MGIKKLLGNVLTDLLNWLHEEKEEGPRNVGGVRVRSGNKKSPTAYLTDETNFEGGVNFTIYSANGGKIIQTRSYDRVTDRNNNALYIITDNDDIGEEISQIITKERLTR